MRTTRRGEGGEEEEGRKQEANLESSFRGFTGSLEEAFFIEQDSIVTEHRTLLKAF